MSRDDNGRSALGGLLIGALGGAIAVILSDKKKRQRIQETLADWISTGEEKLEDMTNRGRHQLASRLDELSDKIDDEDAKPRRRGRAT